jgi:hypothetical protein
MTVKYGTIRAKQEEDSASLRLLENVKKQGGIIICPHFIITFYLRSNYGLAS